MQGIFSHVFTLAKALKIHKDKEANISLVFTYKLSKSWNYHAVVVISSQQITFTWLT